jgi:hypothetical protein
MFERDIIIIGGGPSGLSTALHIARDFPALVPRVLILTHIIYPIKWKWFQILLWRIMKPFVILVA